MLETMVLFKALCKYICNQGSDTMFLLVKVKSCFSAFVTAVNVYTGIYFIIETGARFDLKSFLSSDHCSEFEYGCLWFFE